MRAWYFSSITFLFSLRAGVSSPPWRQKSREMILHFLIIRPLETAFLFTFSKQYSMNLLIFSFLAASSVVLMSTWSWVLKNLITSAVKLCEGMPLSTSTLNVTIALRNNYFSPRTIILEQGGHIFLKLSSIIKGFTVSPPAVIIKP